MADDVILVNESGTTNLQAYTNTVSGKPVKAVALVPVDLAGVPVPRGTLADPVFSKITDGTNTVAITTGAPIGSQAGIVVHQGAGQQQTVGLATGAVVGLAANAVLPIQGIDVT